MKSCFWLKVREAVSFSVSLSKSEDDTMKEKLEDGEIKMEDLYCNNDGNDTLCSCCG